MQTGPKTKKTKATSNKNSLVPRIHTLKPYTMNFCFVWTPAQWDAAAAHAGIHFPDTGWEQAQGGLHTAGATWTPANVYKGLTIIGVNMLLCTNSPITRAIGVLSHEVSHAALALCADIGYDMRKEDEPYCYLVAHILETGLKEMMGLWPTGKELAISNKQFLLDNARGGEITFMEQLPTP